MTLIRMRSVVTAVKLTLRLTRLLPVTVASGYPGAAIPTLDVKSCRPYREKVMRIGGLDRVGVVVLHRIDHHPVDALAAIEIDLHPVRPSVWRGIVPAGVAIAPVGPGALVVVDPLTA